MKKSRMPLEGPRNVPTAWVKCSSCCGTGYVFSGKKISHRDRIRGVVAYMTNDKCNDCLGHGFIRFIDD
ncbi:MAG TPA: hypothetical protein VFH04_00525 [Nitrososphaeraceae archaeon]|nr:hypothetical protein [Nitrososphaeraceae archaeon]